MGIGPGNPQDRTRRAEAAISASQVVVGYTRYLASLRDLTDGKEIIATGMRREKERCRAALKRADDGAVVALVSSGDPGVYGMAGLALEMAAAEGVRAPIEVVPGVSAAQSAAARLGAPLALDYACISLSDLLVPWEVIRARLEAVAAGDLVTALYNPRSKRRTAPLREALEIFRRHRPGHTPVGLATAMGTPEERVQVSDLEHISEQAVNMQTVVIIGNRSSYCREGRFITPRGYIL